MSILLIITAPYHVAKIVFAVVVIHMAMMMIYNCLE